MHREIILDTETTGLHPGEHRIIEIGCIELIDKVRTGKYFHTYVNPQRDVPIDAYRIHGISTEFLLDKLVFKEIAEEFKAFIDGARLVIHNASFDMKFINFEFSNLGHPPIDMIHTIDTLLMARKKFPGSPASLDALCKRFNIDIAHRTKHGALLDAELLADVYIELCGGNQTKLEFVKNTPKETLAEIQTLEIRESRNFKITDEEEKLHQELLTKIKNPLW